MINSRTAKYHFGHEYSEEYEDPYVSLMLNSLSLFIRVVRYKQMLNRQQPIFERALQTFVETIRPNAHNAALIRAARSELASILSLPAHSPTARNDDLFSIQDKDAEVVLTQHNTDPYIAVHIRRGDRHASSFPYRGQYVPLEKFVEAAHATWERLYGADTDIDTTQFPAPPIVYAASDSHTVIEEFMSALPTSSAVFSLGTSTDPALRALAPQHEYVQDEFAGLGEQERVRLTRGMVVDLAMVSGLWAWDGDVVPGATVCTLRLVESLVSCLFTSILTVVGWDTARMSAGFPQLVLGGTALSALETEAIMKAGISMTTGSGG